MDFTQITSILNSGSTGILVSLILALANFVSTRKNAEKQATVADYVEWLRKQNHQEILDSQRDILSAIEREGEEAKLLRSYVGKILHHVEYHTSMLNEIVERTKLLPNMDSKLDYLVDQLSRVDSPALHKGQVAVCTKVLNILSTGLSGSGINVMMDKQFNVDSGTIIVVWLLGTKSPHMMLADCVGSIHHNRVSLILNSDASITLRAYDSNSRKADVTSISYEPCDHLVIFGIWKGREISLWINGENQGSASMSRTFDYLGPLCLFGIDVEGILSADAVRWTPPGESVGLNFRKDGIWHGSRYDTIIIFEEALKKNQIDKMTEDPFALFRPPQPIKSKFTYEHRR